MPRRGGVLGKEVTPSVTPNWQVQEQVPSISSHDGGGVLTSYQGPPRAVGAKSKDHFHAHTDQSLILLHISPILIHAFE